jgi:hypothetical protein
LSFATYPALRPDRLVRLCARLVLLAIVFQLFAVDHWQHDPAEVVGLEGSSAHALHCHGGSDCAGGAGVLFAAPPVHLQLLPSLAAARAGAVQLSEQEPRSQFFSPSHPPPQASLHRL